MSEAPLDLQAVEAHLAELRELHRLPFSETAPRDAIDQARAIELGQALRLADVLLAELRSVRVAAGAGDPSGPWRVAQSSGATPRPPFVEYWEGPLPEQYGARWVPNGFPSAEEAQAVCDALNALRQKDRA